MAMIVSKRRPVKKKPLRRALGNVNPELIRFFESLGLDRRSTAAEAQRFLDRFVEERTALDSGGTSHAPASIGD